MNRAAALFANDVRLQIRYGLYTVSLVMVLVWGSILAGLARGAGLPADVLVPPFVALNLLITTFYFMAALLLFEKGEGVLTALVTTPVTGIQYLLSKAISLSLLATAETVFIVVFTFGWGAAGLRVAAASLILGVLYSLAGFIAVVRMPSINQFLMPSVPMAMLLLVPLLAHFQLVPDAALIWHPVQPAIHLMQGKGMAAAVLAVVWCVAAALVARRDFRRFVVRA